jgi:hypothetical protein
MLFTVPNPTFSGSKYSLASVQVVDLANSPHHEITHAALGFERGNL